MNEIYFYKTCIQSELAKRVSKNKAYSLRAFAKALKLEPGALSQILSGKRVPSYKATKKILSTLELTPIKRRDFLNSLAEHQQARGLIVAIGARPHAVG